MPSLIDQFRVKKDRRRKLTDQDREKIKALYDQGMPVRKITRIINKVDNKAIRYFLFPEVREKQRLRLKAHNYYYDKGKHKEYMRKFRQHLREEHGAKMSS